MKDLVNPALANVYVNVDGMEQIAIHHVRMVNMELIVTKSVHLVYMVMGHVTHNWALVSVLLDGEASVVTVHVNRASGVSTAPMNVNAKMGQSAIQRQESACACQGGEGETALSLVRQGTSVTTASRHVTVVTMFPAEEMMDFVNVYPDGWVPAVHKHALRDILVVSA